MVDVALLGLQIGICSMSRNHFISPEDARRRCNFTLLIVQASGPEQIVNSWYGENRFRLMIAMKMSKTERTHAISISKNSKSRGVDTARQCGNE